MPQAIAEPERFNPESPGVSAPIGAFKLSATKFELAGEQKESTKSGRMTARTGDVIEHWWWGRIVHDLAGMVSKERIALDWMHRDDEIVGFAEQFDSSGGDLECDVTIASVEAGDEADKIIKRSALGVPYEASIDWDPWTHILEWIGEGFTVNVNGRELEGPLVVVRQWELRRIAVCPSGADSGTSTELTEQGAEVARFAIQWSNSKMSKSANTDSPETPSGESKLTPDGGTSTDSGKATSSAPNTAPESGGNAELTKFCAQFGNEKGAEYLLAGLSFEDALAKSNTDLQAELKAANEGKDQAETKLSQMDLGEESAVETGLSAGGKAGGDKGNWSSNFSAAQSGAKPKK